jgi:hypothetical protein
MLYMLIHKLTLAMSYMKQISLRVHFRCRVLEDQLYPFHVQLVQGLQPGDNKLLIL